MQTNTDVHLQFADFFRDEKIKPFLYLLSKKMSEGHICIDTNEIEATLLSPVFSDTKWNKSDLKKNHLVSSKETDYKPFVLYQNKLYLQRYFLYENQLLNQLQLLTNESEANTIAVREQLASIKKTVQQLFSDNLGNSTDWQLVAAISAFLNKFTIITGGPGTGKTTTVAKLLTMLLTNDPNIKIVLAAPTGKASARMAESIANIKFSVTDEVKSKLKQLQPYTIHRLLGWQKGSLYFRHNKLNPLPYDVVIVDECSMIDLALFSKLLQSIAPNTKVILLGDKNQLSSVEAGSIFSDLCSSLPAVNQFSKGTSSFINSFIRHANSKIPTENIIDTSSHPLFERMVTLQQSHRFSSDSGIGKLGHAVITSNTQILKSMMDSTDVAFTIDSNYSKDIFEAFVTKYSDYIAEQNDIYKALLLFNKIKVLCATRKGEMGVHQTNLHIQEYLLKREKIKKQDGFYENMPIMVTENNYDLGLFNGDIGIMRKDEQGVLKAWFIDEENTSANRIKSVIPGYINKYELVYAMTIHKSQGSEFEEVFIRLPKQSESQLLTRELLYTGITRAKSKVTIQTTEDVLLETAERTVERGSGISERLVNE